jgi:hypothetical protein
MDTQWEILMSNNSRMSRFDQLKCRIAIANSIQPLSFVLLLLTASFAMVFNRSNLFVCS